MIGVDKRELISEILRAQESGTSGTACAICVSDYECDDVQRRLPCGHLFHLECVDQWILKAATDYSRTPGCPMCNKPVI